MFKSVLAQQISTTRNMCDSYFTSSGLLFLVNSFILKLTQIN